MARQEDEGIVSGYKSLHKSGRQLRSGAVSFAYIERTEDMRMLSDTKITDNAMKQALRVLSDESEEWLHIAQAYRSAWDDMWFMGLDGDGEKQQIFQRAYALLNAAICFRLGVRAMVWKELAFLMWGDEYESMPGALS